MRLKYISGFSGSSGTAIITATKAALWTDGRYHAQADNELACDWLLMGRGENAVCLLLFFFYLCYVIIKTYYFRFF